MRSFATFSLVIALAAAVGCGESPAPQQVSQNQQGTTAAATEAVPGFKPQRPAKQYGDPQDAVNDFLIAVKSGDDAAATSLLSTAAQQEAWTNGLAISSEGFPDARFKISEVQYLQENQQAHVMTVWENKREYGQQKSFECVWLLRQESHGWSIYGMATKLEIEPPQPLVLNFENQPEMQKRQRWAQEQINKYAELQQHRQQAGSHGPVANQQQSPAQNQPLGSQATLPGQSPR